MIKIKEESLTVEQLKAFLHYDPITGLFTWKIGIRWGKNGGKLKKTRRAGGKTSKGYIAIQVDGSRHQAHRLAWLYMTGSWPKYLIDHKDRIKHNNAFLNLREADNSENKINSELSVMNTSGFRGVYKRGRRWIAVTKVKGRSVHIGQFDNSEKACIAYKDFIVSEFGQFFPNL